MTGNGEAVNLGEKVGVEFGRRLQLGVLYERIKKKKMKTLNKDFTTPTKLT